MSIKKFTYVCTGILLASTMLTACGNTQQSSSSDSSSQRSSRQVKKPSRYRIHHRRYVTNQYLAETHFNNRPDWYVKHAKYVYRASLHGNPNDNVFAKGAVDSDPHNDSSIGVITTGINMKYATNRLYMIGWIIHNAHERWRMRTSSKKNVRTVDLHRVTTPSRNVKDYQKAIALYKSGVEFAEQYNLPSVCFGNSLKRTVLWESAKDQDTFKGPHRKVPVNLIRYTNRK